MTFKEAVNLMNSDNAITSKTFCPNSIIIKHIANFLPSDKIPNMVSFGTTAKDFAKDSDGIQFADSYMMLTKKAENYVYAESIMEFMFDFEHITDWEVIDFKNE